MCVYYCCSDYINHTTRQYFIIPMIILLSHLYNPLNHGTLDPNYHVLLVLIYSYQILTFVCIELCNSELLKELCLRVFGVENWCSSILKGLKLWYLSLHLSCNSQWSPFLSLHWLQQSEYLWIPCKNLNGCSRVFAVFYFFFSVLNFPITNRGLIYKCAFEPAIIFVKCITSFLDIWDVVWSCRTCTNIITLMSKTQEIAQLSYVHHFLYCKVLNVVLPSRKIINPFDLIGFSPYPWSKVLLEHGA